MDEDDLLDDDEILDDVDSEELEAEVESEETESAEEDLLVKGFRQYGINIPDGLDGKTLASNISAMARRMQSLPSDMELAEMREAKARYQQDREASREETPAQEKSRKLQKPEGAEDYVVFDQKRGHYVPKDAQYPNLKAVEEMNSWHRQVEANKRRMLEDPEEYFRSTLDLDKRLEEVEKRARESALKEFREAQQQEALEREYSQFWEKHAPELYQTSENGYVKTDPLTGQPILSEKGFKFLEAKAELERKYPNNNPLVVEREAYEAATRWEKTQKARSAKKQPEPVEELEADEQPEDPTFEDLAEAQKRSFAKKARAADERGKSKGDRVINRDASLVRAARTGDDQNSGVTDFMAIAKAEYRKKGIKF